MPRSSSVWSGISNVWWVQRAQNGARDLISGCGFQSKIFARFARNLAPPFLKSWLRPCSPWFSWIHLDLHNYTTLSHIHTHATNSYLTVWDAWLNALQLLSDKYFVGSWLCSSLAYFMMTHPLPIASKLPIKTLVARQLPTNIHAYTTWVYGYT